MAGFLDRKERVVDMVLTNKGRKLLSEGKLNFSFWSVFDDEVDYSPTDDEQRVVDLTEDSLVLEAVFGYRDGNGILHDKVNVRNPIFTDGKNDGFIQRMEINPDRDLTISSDQKKLSNKNVVSTVDVGFERLNASVENIWLGYDGFPVDGRPEGFLVEFYVSGSDGLQKVEVQRDLSNTLVIRNDLSVVLE